MTTVNIKGLKNDYLPYAGAPYGNAYREKFSFETTSAGVVVGSDLSTALQIADKVYIGIIPAGTRIDDALAIISDAFTAAATFKIGFEYVDGTDVTAVPQDDDYFFAALAKDLGRTPAANTGVRPVVLPKPAYVTLVLAGAALDAVGKLDLIVAGGMVGVNG